MKLTIDIRLVYEVHGEIPVNNEVFDAIQGLLSKYIFVSGDDISPCKPRWQLEFKKAEVLNAEKE